MMNDSPPTLWPWHRLAMSSILAVGRERGVCHLLSRPATEADQSSVPRTYIYLVLQSSDP